MKIVYALLLLWAVLGWSLVLPPANYWFAIAFWGAALLNMWRYVRA